MSALETVVEPSTVRVPGASLYVEVQGEGPTLLCIPGGPTDAGSFADLAGRLAAQYTVVCYDPRGHSRSALDDGSADIPVARHADDAAAILRAGGGWPAYVYGNSSGGTIGVELVARHPDLVRRLVAHEAPIVELLPDAAKWRSAFAVVYKTYRAEGVFPAIAKLCALVDEGGPRYIDEMDRKPPSREEEEAIDRMVGNFDLFFAHEVRQIGGYVPDFDVLLSVSTRIVSAAGEGSGEQAARRAAIALAERLGGAVKYLPGGHGGWGSDPEELAERLDVLLRGS